MSTNFSHRLIPYLQKLESNKLQERTTKTNFVFRVFDDNSQGTYTEETGFTAGAFSEGGFRNKPPQDFHKSVVAHVEREYKQSPWISASRRWDWAVWEMCRRQQQFGSNINIRVAVIDFHRLRASSRSRMKLDSGPYFNHTVHALQFLKPTESGTSQLTKLEHFANIADELLFYGCIPAYAVLSVVELEDVVHYAPGYDAGWLKSTSYRDSHWAMRRDHLSRIKWDAGRYGLECAHLAWALLRPRYNILKSLIWSILLDVAVGSSISPMTDNESVTIEKQGYPMRSVDSLADEMLGLLVKDAGNTPNPTVPIASPDYSPRIRSMNDDPPKPRNIRSHVDQRDTESWYTQIEFSWAQSQRAGIETPENNEGFDEEATQKLSTVSSGITKSIAVLKLSLLLLKEETIRDELHTAYIQTSALDPSEPCLLSDLEDCLRLIYATAADLLGQLDVAISPDIKLRIHSAQQKLEEFTDDFVALAAGFPFSHIESMKDTDWAILKLRVEEAVGPKLKWLHEALQLLRRPDATRRALWLKETVYEDACRWFQP
ncbi:hypothetical protein FRC09_005209 [Ceratobasidium sp. 395]|nr:hypothetical protein FRC09_005209 [Ceratobasidium sp. 395]